MNNSGNYYENGLTAYIKDVRYRQHSKEELQQAFADFFADRTNKRAFDTIVESHLKLTFFLAKKYRFGGAKLLDLIQEASLGLMYAIHKFDPGRGVLFTTFVTPVIRHRLIKYIQSKGHLIHLPRKVQLEMLKEDPDNPRYSTMPLESFDGRIPEEARFIEALETEDYNEKLHYTLLGVLKAFPKTERAVIINSYGLQGGKALSTRELGRLMGCSYNNVHYFHKKAMARLATKKSTLREFVTP